MKRSALALALLLALSVALAARAPRARADEPVMQLRATAGDSISPAETAAIHKTLDDYLDALRKHDYERAGEFIERTSLLAQAEAMVRQSAPDSTNTGPTRAQMFGVASRDSLAARPTGKIFAAFMHYMDSVNPGANQALEDASIQVLAARRMKDTVHVAYQLTLPPNKERKEPYTQVTAQRMRQVDGKWRILVSE